MNILSIAAETADPARAATVLAPVLALLLGLRHATDPDHLAAVSTLVLGSRPGHAAKAGALGLSWGMGHALTLVVLGIPIVAFGHSLPGVVQGLAELLVGLVVVFLALRLLSRWRRGHFHTHAHAHGTLYHTHAHFHEHTAGSHHPVAHQHRHEALGRSHRSAFGIGMIHGIGGSAGIGILLVTAAGRPAEAGVALLLFAAGTAISMALVSAGFGYVLGREPVTRNLRRLVPVFGVLTLLFGIWYALGALDVVPLAF